MAAWCENVVAAAMGNLGAAADVKREVNEWVNLRTAGGGGGGLTRHMRRLRDNARSENAARALARLQEYVAVCDVRIEVRFR